MSERKVMGYWDCPSCGAKEIQGTIRVCPNCAKPRDENIRFYMKSKDHEEVVRNNEYLTEDQAKKKGNGPDWECSYCGSLNNSLDMECQSCGHIRDDADRDYFKIKEQGKPEQTQAVSTATTVSKTSPEREIPKSNQKKKTKKWKYGILLAVFAMIASFVFFLLPKEKTIHVIDKTWEYSVEVEKYKQVEDSDWSLPDDAELQHKEKEIHHYDQVLDHYETKTRTYTEREKVGSHTEYSYEDNGDGTFTEKSHVVDDYDTVTKTEEYEDPVYINVPVYQTKYYYLQWRWVHERDVKTNGDYKQEPAYGDTKLLEDEREGQKTEQYYVKGFLGKKEDKIKTYTIDKGNWEAVNVGKNIKAKVKSDQIIELYVD